MHNLKIIKGFLPLHDASVNEYFNELYIALRLKEKRIFSNKELATLPRVPLSHLHYKEWSIRKNSCYKLLHYIKKHSHICNILEVGCGNGWLSSNLSKVARGNVTAIDINIVELQQARKVFGKIHNLNFIEGDIRSGILGDRKYDLIVFAASIQYFSSLNTIIKKAIEHLTLQGEIHIVDTRLYHISEIAEAKERSIKYFAEMKFPEMTKFYFHHSIEDLKVFSFSVFFNPYSLRNKLMFRKNPFHWIVIKNHYS